MPSESTQAEALAAAAAALGIGADSGLFHRFDPAVTVAALLEKLIALSDAQVLDLLAVVVADTRSVGSPEVDTLGVALGAKVSDHWQPDGAFLIGVRNRQAMQAMADEVLGQDAAAAKADTMIHTRAVMAEALANRNQPWCPRWCQFPATRYTGPHAEPVTSADAGGHPKHKQKNELVLEAAE